MTWDDTFDPGFTGRMIFDATFGKHKLTSDGRYKVPDHVNVVNKKGCKFAFDGHYFKYADQIQKYYASLVGYEL